MIANIIYFILALAWILLLFWIGKNKGALLFYALVYLHLIIPAIFLVIALPAIITVFGSISVWAIALLILIIAERIVWGVTLREIAGKDELIWFYFVYPIPLIGWLFYRIVHLR